MPFKKTPPFYLLIGSLIAFSALFIRGAVTQNNQVYVPGLPVGDNHILDSVNLPAGVYDTSKTPPKGGFPKDGVIVIYGDKKYSVPVDLVYANEQAYKQQQELRKQTCPPGEVANREDQNVNTNKHIGPSTGQSSSSGLSSVGPNSPVATASGTSSGGVPPALPKLPFPTGDTDNEQGLSIVQSAKDIMLANQKDAENDDLKVKKNYENLPTPAVQANLKRAETSLRNTANKIEEAQVGLDQGERNRFRNIFLNAADKAAAINSEIQDAQNKENTLGSLTPFKGLLGPGELKPEGALKNLASLFGIQTPESSEEGRRAIANENPNQPFLAPPPTSNDALINRTMLFNGLPKDQQDALLNQMKLVDKPGFELPNGKVETIPILHNGYIFGGSETATDCSAFATAALPIEIRKTRFTTLDFVHMWIYRRLNKWIEPPKFPKDRAKLLKETSKSFDAVDIYEGEKLRPGDLLVHRFSYLNSGHVWLVRDYDANQMRATVIEASQSAGTIRERPMDLSLDPPESHDRHFAMGLYALRVKTQAGTSCRVPLKAGNKVRERTVPQGSAM